MNTEIKVDIDFLEDSIWMSYRYCIGRKTIAAAMRADDIVRYIKYLPEHRIQFMAMDIRREISNQINWAYNMSVEGFEYNYDALSLLYKYITDNNIKDDKKYKFYINVTTGEVWSEDYERKEGQYIEKVSSWYHDMIGWIKLANYCDKKHHLNIKVNYEEEEKEYLGFGYPVEHDGKYETKYIDIESYENSPHNTRYFEEKYITNLDELQ